MISIEIPDYDADRIGRWRDFGVPYISKALLFAQTYRSEYRYPVDYISQGKQLYKENDVDNSQAFVTLSYRPIYGGLTSSPKAGYPDRLVTTTGKELLKGMLRPYGPVFSSDTYGMHISCIVINEDKKYEFIDLTYHADFPMILRNAYHEELVSVDNVSSTYSMNHCRSSWIKAALTPVSVSIPDCDPEQMLMLVRQNCLPWSGVGSAGSPFNWTPTSKPPFVSPSQALEWVYAQLYPLVTYAPFPINTIDSGLLAMQACEKFNSNHVNMLEFLSDMRNPTELIPKLRNLSQLKGLRGLKNASSEYLRTKFGILPTISDLQGIVSAFHSHASFIDANGFRIETAHHSDDLVKDGYTFHLDQYVKVASETEDIDFLSLAAGLDNLGMLPNLENVWDLVPFSFAIDWFVNVGSLLERIDARSRVAYLKVKYATLSQKTSIKKLLSPSNDWPYDVTLEWVHYHRWTTDHCPVPNLTLPEMPYFNHWLESGALIIQRLLKRRH